MASNEIVSEALQADKKKMREVILRQRDAMSPSARTSASRVILEKICALPQYGNAKVVLTYMGFGTEIETQPFFERIIADGKIVALPRVDRATQTLILHSARGVTDLLTSKYGILEPSTDAPVVAVTSVDFVLMPGVAFDRNGNRLGYGRGYYDKLMSSANLALARVAAGFSCQIVDSVPVGPQDKKVDCIITENEIIKTTHDR